MRACSACQCGLANSQPTHGSNFFPGSWPASARQCGVHESEGTLPGNAFYALLYRWSMEFVACVYIA